jgi:hypothetical protein
MKKANGVDVMVRENGQDFLVELAGAQMDDLIDGSRLLRDGSHIMRPDKH